LHKLLPLRADKASKSFLLFQRPKWKITCPILHSCTIKQTGHVPGAFDRHAGLVASAKTASKRAHKIKQATPISVSKPIYCRCPYCLGKTHGALLMMQ